GLERGERDLREADRVLAEVEPAVLDALHARDVLEPAVLAGDLLARLHEVGEVAVAQLLELLHALEVLPDARLLGAPRREREDLLERRDRAVEVAVDRLHECE